MEGKKKEKKNRKIVTKNLIRMLAFLFLAACISAVCITVFDFDDSEKANTGLDQFYALENNTVDCLFIGSSVTQRDYVVPKAFHDDGIAAYTIASGAQPFVLSKYLIQDALKDQDPEVIIIELKGSCRGPDGISEYGIRKVVDNMRPSMTRMRAIRDVVRYASVWEGNNILDRSGLSYYLPFFKYHSLWNPDNRPKYSGMDYYKGYAIAPNISFRVRGIHQQPIPEDKMPIAPETEKMMMELLDYCDTIDAKVMFMISPYEASYQAMEKMNYSKPLIEERGYEVMDFRSKESRESIGLRDENCYYNKEHLNFYGSEIFTEWFSGYLKEKYDLPDRRGDKKYAEWEEEYERLMSNIERGIYAEKYSKMMSEIRESEKEDK